MADAVYILCALTSVFCAWLLYSQFRRQRTRLLMCSALCFVGLALNSIAVIVDVLVVPQVDLSALRTTVAAVAMLLLLLGLIWEAR